MSQEVWGFNFNMSSPPGLASTNAFTLTAWDDTRNSDPNASASVYAGGFGGGLQDIYAAAVQYKAVGGGASKAVKGAVVGLLAVGLVLSVAALATRRRRGPSPTATVTDRSSAGVS